jgi:hypothetical protein
MIGYPLKVNAHKAQRFLVGLLEYNRCNFNQLLTLIRERAVVLQGSIHE